MKKYTVFAIAAALMLSGCSMTGDPTPTEAPETAAAPPTLVVLDEYALLNGYTLYQSADSAVSIQLPEGSTVSDEDASNISITLPSTFAKPDTINIAKVMSAQHIDSFSALYESLKDDDTIDIDALYVINKNGTYEGYKYVYHAIDDPQLKGIRSYYFSSDDSAYIVNATIYNGGDDANFENINTIVDTFINYL